MISSRSSSGKKSVRERMAPLFTGTSSLYGLFNNGLRTAGPRVQAAKSSVQVLVPGHDTTTETPTGKGRSALIKVIERMQEDKSTNFVTVEGARVPTEYGVDQTTPTQQEVENLGDGEFKVSAYTHIRKEGRNVYEVLFVRVTVTEG